MNHEWLYCECCPSDGSLCGDCLRDFLCRDQPPPPPPPPDPEPDPPWLFWSAALLASLLLGLALACLIVSLPR